MENLHNFLFRYKLQIALELLENNFTLPPEEYSFAEAQFNLNHMSMDSNMDSLHKCLEFFLPFMLIKLTNLIACVWTLDFVKILKYTAWPTSRHSQPLHILTWELIYILPDHCQNLTDIALPCNPFFILPILNICFTFLLSW